MDAGAGSIDTALLGDSGGCSSSSLADVPIEQRRCPPSRRFNHPASGVPSVVRRGRPQRYALRESELSEGLRRELAALHSFLTQRFFGAQSEPITEGTARKYADWLR